MEATQEQIDIVKASMTGDNLLIEAKAGCTKSSTMLLVMQYNPNKKFLLVTFSSHLAKEGLMDKKKHNLQNFFPMTMHKLAKTYTIDTGSVTILGQSYDINNNGNIQPWIHGNTLVDAYGQYANPWDLGRELKEFCESTSSTFENNPAMAKLFIGIINMGLMTHDIYMKLFTLGIKDKSILLSKYYDVFTIDECQDLGTQIGSLAINNDIQQQIVLGDRYQAIFEFLLKGYSLFDEPKLRVYTKLSLTHTFRCTQHVCNLALVVLRKLGYEGEYTGYDRTGRIETTFYISRTNIQCFFTMLQMADAGLQFDTGVDLNGIRNVLSSFLFITTNKDAIMFSNSVKELRAIEHYDKLDSEYKEHCKAYVNDSAKQDGISIAKYIEDNTGQSFSTVIEILDVMTKRELGISELFTYVSKNIVKGHSNLINNPFKLKG